MVLAVTVIVGALLFAVAFAVARRSVEAESWSPMRLLTHSATMTSNVTKHITYGFQGKRVRSTVVTRRTLTITNPEQ